jgi:hypothetical protein
MQRTANRWLCGRPSAGRVEDIGAERRQISAPALCAVQHFAGGAPQREKSREQGKVARCTVQGLIEPRSAPTSWETSWREQDVPIPVENAMLSSIN